MRYTPKHNAAKNSTAGRKAAGVALVGAATVGAGVAQASGASAASGSVWDRVAACESGGNWSISTGNGFQGGLQFTQQTWAGYGGKAYASSANGASRAQQIAVAQKVLAGQGAGAWPVCGAKAGLSRGNGGMSSAPAATQATHTTARSAVRHAATKHVATTTRFGTKRVVAQAPVMPKRGTVVKTGAAPVAPTAVAPVAKHSLLVVDGILGPRTARALQAQLGSFQDGIVGPKTKAALQAWVGTFQDGVVGPRTIAALQTKLGLLHDGSSHLNARTVRALQAYLNNH